MPLQAGEVCLLALFADVHYYFNSPAAKPVHHRFERRAYLYLYHDALNKRGRLEIANSAGTPDQDAFSGYLDTAKLEYSHQQSTLVSISPNTRQAGCGTPQNDLSQWHLPAYDLSNENKYMYRLHAVDLYLWAAEDATMLLDSVKRFLRPEQLAISDLPADVHAEHRDSMSPVVQHLEKAVISSPQHAHSDGEPHHQGIANEVLAVPVRPPQTETPTSQQQVPPPPRQAFAPLAYNPAAPAAPEQRVHREKTPPPEDAEEDTGLGLSSSHEYTGITYGVFPQACLPGPPSDGPPSQSAHAVGFPTHFGSTGLAQTPAFAPLPQAPLPQDPKAHPYAQQQAQTSILHRQPTYSATQHAAYSCISGTSGAASPGVLQASGFQQSLGHVNAHSPGLPSPQTPGHGPAGTQVLPSTYPFNPNQTQHSIHKQIYIPEDGASHTGQGLRQSNGSQPTTSLGKRADKIEKGIGKFLKKLDSKY